MNPKTELPEPVQNDPALEPIPYAARMTTRDDAAPAEPMARLSLRSGILFWLTPIPCIVAIIAGSISLDRLRRQPQRGRAAARAGIVLGTVGTALWVAAVPGILHLNGRIRQLHCQDNLRTLGQMIFVYAAEHKGRLPDSWEDMVAGSGTILSLSKNLACPEWGDTPPSAATTQTAIADMRAGGRISYLYLGKAKLVTQLRPSMPLVMDAAPHRDGSVFVLYADGHSVPLSHAQAVQLLQRVLDDAKAGSTSRPASVP
jgi:hypothetical protein